MLTNCLAECAHLTIIVTQIERDIGRKSSFFQTNHFNKHLNLSQIVKDATRKNSILDKIFTNCSNFYASPTILSPVGKSDHNCVLVKPKCYYAYTKVESRVVTKQNLSEQVLDNLAYAINSIPGYVLYE